MWAGALARLERTFLLLQLFDHMKGTLCSLFIHTCMQVYCNQPESVFRSRNLSNRIHVRYIVPQSMKFSSGYLSFFFCFLFSGKKYSTNIGIVHRLESFQCMVYSMYRVLVLAIANYSIGSIELRAALEHKRYHYDLFRPER